MINILENQKLSSWASWLVGGHAEYYCAPKSEEDISQALVWAHNNKKTITVLGAGTNVLIHDDGIDGLVIHTKDFNQWGTKESDNRLVFNCQAGTLKSEALKVFMKYRLPPAIFLAGLPGDIAGGVVMNAGVGHNVEPKEFCNIVDGFEVMRLNEAGEVEKLFFNHANLQWQYRHCLGWQPGVITQVQLSWPLEPDNEVLVQVREGNKRRKNTQPLNHPSCGSVFKNPPGQHSGALIEKAGLKGFKIGGAMISNKHANFIVNTGNGTAADIHQVICHVQKTILDQFNISLTNEVVYLGWDNNHK